MNAPDLKSILEEARYIAADRKRFDETLYTPLPEAYDELRRRRSNHNLEQNVLRLLSHDIPEPLRTEPKAVIFRHVLTPNYELRRFTELVHAFGKLQPLFWEYHTDKYTPNNELKRTIGRLFFFNGRGKKNGARINSLNVIDFNTSNGKPIGSLMTTWGQSLIDFHHEFFQGRYQSIPGPVFDASHWFHNNGKISSAYYRSFLSLFLMHGILFENAMLNEAEHAFTTTVFLPAFLMLKYEFGLKPLIVALEPTHEEHDHYWMCYPAADRQFVESKMRSD